MLKTASVAGSANINLEQSNQRVQIGNQDENKLAQKSYKSQKTAKSKKWICTKKTEASRAKNLGQLGKFFIVNARKTFTK